MYIHLYIKKNYSFSLIFSKSVFRLDASFSETTSRFSIRDSIPAVLFSSKRMPAGVSCTTVCLLSLLSVCLLTSFFSTKRSMMRGTLEFLSIILPAISFTHIISGAFPFRMRITLNCSWVSPYTFNSLLIVVFNHHDV